MVTGAKRPDSWPFGPDLCGNRLWRLEFPTFFFSFFLGFNFSNCCSFRMWKRLKTFDIVLRMTCQSLGLTCDCMSLPWIIDNLAYSQLWKSLRKLFRELSRWCSAVVRSRCETVYHGVLVFLFLNQVSSSSAHLAPAHLLRRWTYAGGLRMLTCVDELALVEAMSDVCPHHDAGILFDPVSSPTQSKPSKLTSTESQPTQSTVSQSSRPWPGLLLRNFGPRADLGRTSGGPRSDLA